MKIFYLKGFLAIAELGSYQNAAEEIFLSQPSLSRHIKLLEKELGVTVFDRTTRKIELNKYGQMLLPYAKEICRLYEELASNISDSQRDTESSITIGSVPTMAQYDLTDLLVYFKMKFPFFPINIMEGSTHTLVALLERKQCDFAFIRIFRTHNEKLSDKIETLALTSDTMVALMSSGHSLAKENHLELIQFKNESLFLPKGDLLQNKLIASFREAGFEPNIAFSGSRSDDIVDMARKGMGIAFLLKSSVRSLQKDGISTAELGSEFVLDVSLAYLKSRKMNHSHAMFLDSINMWISNRSEQGNPLYAQI